MGDPDIIKKVPDRWIVRDLHNEFLGEYDQSVGHMLEFLLCLISYKIQSEKDAWSLYKRIIKLQIMLNEQLSIIEAKGVEYKFLTSNSMIKSSLFHLEPVSERFSQNDDYRDFAKKKGIPIGELTTNLISMITNFRNQFLKDYP